jgi:hypothetical protein
LNLSLKSLNLRIKIEETLNYTELKNGDGEEDLILLDGSEHNINFTKNNIKIITKNTNLNKLNGEHANILLKNN